MTEVMPVLTQMCGIVIAHRSGNGKDIPFVCVSHRGRTLWGAVRTDQSVLTVQNNGDQPIDLCITTIVGDVMQEDSLRFAAHSVVHQIPLPKVDAVTMLLEYEYEDTTWSLVLGFALLGAVPQDDHKSAEPKLVLAG